MSFVSFDKITIRVRDKFLFRDTSLKFEKTDNLLVVGANGSGKTTFVKAIGGLLPVSQGEIVFNFLDDPLPYPSVHKDKIAYVSFDGHKKIHLENEFKKELEDFTGKSQKVLNLSTGQTRKYLIEKALEKKPEILILDEPFDGLDIESRKDLKKLVEELSKKVFLILVTHRMDEVVKGIKKAVFIKDGKVEMFGDCDEVLNEYRLFEGRKTVINSNKSNVNKSKVLIDFEDVSVEFDGKKILEGVSWQVKEGESWVVLGPNGAGKSTLVKLITGENLQVFANKVMLFGKPRSHLGIDEVNKKIAVVSTDRSLKIHDYLLVSKLVRGLVLGIIKKLGIEDMVSKTYGELSFGQKRLVLIAMSLVNNPKILILDEPFHGLDSLNKRKVLEEIERIANNGTTVILITHHEDEIIPSINKVMHLRNGKIEKILSR